MFASPIGSPSAPEIEKTFESRTFEKTQFVDHEAYGLGENREFENTIIDMRDMEVTIISTQEDCKARLTESTPRRNLDLAKETTRWKQGISGEGRTCVKKVERTL